MSVESVIVSEADAPLLRCPSLDNQSEAQWNVHAHVAYLFARHVRHDLANIDAALGMLEAVQRLSAPGAGHKAPPAELTPELVTEKIQLSIRKLAATFNDMALLSQAANRVGYIPMRVMELRDLLHEAIVTKLKGHATPHRMLEAAGDLRIGMLNDALVNALAAFYFQWSPWYHPHARAAQGWLKSAADRVQLGFPADDTEAVASFARRLAMPPNLRVPSVVEHALSISTAELALWMARFLIQIHGGFVEVDPNDPDLTLRVTLPLT